MRPLYDNSAKSKKKIATKGPLAPERLEDILCKLVERRTSRQTEVAERRCALEAQRDKAKDKLARLYRAIEDGAVELDADLKDRIQAIKQERDLAETAIERITDTAASRTQITPERLAAFSDLMRDKLDTGDIHARKAYLRALYPGSRWVMKTSALSEKSPT